MNEWFQRDYNRDHIKIFTSYNFFIIYKKRGKLTFIWYVYIY